MIRYKKEFKQSLVDISAYTIDPLNKAMGFTYSMTYRILATTVVQFVFESTTNKY